MGGGDGVDPARAARRRAAFGVGKLMMGVACFGVIFWAVRSALDNAKPSLRLARTLSSGPAADRRQAVDQLGQVGPEDADVAAPALVAALRDPDEEVRVGAARGLQLLVRPPSAAEIDHPALTSALGAAMGDRSDRVRDEALAALLAVARAAPVRPPPALAEILARGEPASARAKVAAALPEFRLDRPDTIARLASALNDPDPEVVQAAAAALGKIGPDALPARARLIAILQGPEVPPTVRAAGEFPNSPGIAAALAIGAISKDPMTAPAGVEALEQVLRLGPRSCRPAAAEALFSLGKLAAPATPTLVATLREGARPDGGQDFESWAARALGVLAPGTEWACPTIRGLIEGLGAPSAGMRHHSALALGEFGPDARAALPRLREVEQGPDRYTAKMAAAAIRKIEGPPASPR